MLGRTPVSGAAPRGRKAGRYCGTIINKDMKGASGEGVSESLDCRLQDTTYSPIPCILIKLYLGEIAMGDKDRRETSGRRSGKDRRGGEDTRTKEEKRLVGERRVSDRRSSEDRRQGDTSEVTSKMLDPSDWFWHFGLGRA